jgi:DNA (cytosine-5)-methyltransferase 1
MSLVGKDFLKFINNEFATKIGSGKKLQKLYEHQSPSKNLLEPTELVDLIQELINKHNIENVEIEQGSLKVFKERVPVKQLFALYAINKISTIGNCR